MTHRLTPGTYVAWTGQNAVVGNTARPADLWEVSPFVARLLLRFTGGFHNRSVVDRLPENLRARARQVVDEFERYGILMTPGSAPDDGSIRNVEHEVGRHVAPHADIAAMAPEFEESYRIAQRYTCSSPPVAYALYRSVAHVVHTATPGDVVECGVGLGGSAYLAARSLRELDDTGRWLWLYDTFDGHWEPPGADDGYVADDDRTRLLRATARRNRTNIERDGRQAAAWTEPGHVGADEVRRLVERSGYPAGNVRIVEGLVQQTIPATRPDAVAILRLDTDFYESTLHELQHLYPLLSPGGVLIVDDYGKHLGATRAVDEYFSGVTSPPLLVRLDTQGCLGVKPAPTPADGPAGPSEPRSERR